MNNKQTNNRFLRRALHIFVLALIVTACVEETTPNVTPTVDLTILITNSSAEPQEDARVYLFPFESQYQDYLTDNPDADAGITPTLGPDNIGVTNALGEVTFSNRALEGNSYASGTTWFHRPNSIYVRVETSTGTTVLTNDQGLTKISFDEIEAGEHIAEFVEIEVTE
ncbi:MAG: hypothetical protein AAF587_12910 [Bacteroidota bacterium]